MPFITAMRDYFPGLSSNVSLATRNFGEERRNMGIHGISALVNASVDEAHDLTDVPASLERETHDGAGDLTDLPPSEDIQEVEE